MIKSCTISTDVQDDIEFTNQGCAEQIWHPKWCKIAHIPNVKIVLLEMHSIKIMSQFISSWCFFYVLYICQWMSKEYELTFISGLVAKLNHAECWRNRSTKCETDKFHFFPPSWMVNFLLMEFSCNVITVIAIRRMLLNSVATNLCYMYFGFWSTSTPFFWILGDITWWHGERIIVFWL